MAIFEAFHNGNALTCFYQFDTRNVLAKWVTLSRLVINGKLAITTLPPKCLPHVSN